MPSYTNPWLDYLGGLNGLIRDQFDLDLGTGFGAFKGFWGDQAASRGQAGNQDSFQNWLSGKFGGLQSGYFSKMAQNPSLRWLDYLSDFDPSRAWAIAGPGERGERPQNFYNPRTRWMR